VGSGGRALAGVIVVTTTLIACSTKSHPVPAVDVLPTATAPKPPDGQAARTFAPGVGISLSVPSTWVPAPPSSGFDYVMRDPGPSHAFVLLVRTKSLEADPYTARQDRVHYLRRIGGTVTATAIG